MLRASPLVVGLVAGAAVLGLVWASKRVSGAVGSAAGAVLNAVNPLNDGNVFYTGVNSAGAAATGDASFNLGARLWEWTHPGQVAAEAGALAPSLPGYVALDQDDADMGYAMDVMRANSGAAFGPYSR